MRRGGFFYTPLHANVCLSPAREAKKGLAIWEESHVDSALTPQARKGSVSLDDVGAWKHTVNTLSR